ncbi:MAG: sugar transferase [Planctomycetaceae bacterium]
MATISMVYQTLCNWLTSKPEPTGGEVHDSDRFRGILERERMRADRSGTSFSLISFSLSVSSDKTSESEAFLRHLRTRIRATDYVGWIDAKNVGVTLWNTHREGAWKFVEQIVSSWNGSTTPACNVYVYPSDTQQVGSNGDDSSADNVQAGAGKSLAGTRGRQNAAASSALASMTRTSSLATLFVRPLPAWKRSIDVIGASVGLIVLSPLLAITAVLIKLTSPGPILFPQERDGLGGNLFTVFKFRTMRVGADQLRDELQKFSEYDGPSFKMKYDPRVTPIGKFLRKSCIDELPQLWNVLIGDMSLVGPRPLVRRETVQMEPWHRRRFEVTAGMTCDWQVYGKSQVSFAEWMRMDIRYSRNRTVLRDINLIFATLAAVVFNKVAH